MKTKFILFFSFCAFLIISFYSCNKNKKDISKEEAIKKVKMGDTICVDPICIEAEAFKYDKRFLKNENAKPQNSNWKFFKKNKSQIYFIKKWGTPDFNLNDSVASIFDGQIILGYKKYDKVYYIYKYPTRKKFFDETGDSVLYSERYFRSDALTSDPRQTYWWISNLVETLRDTVTNLDSLNLHEFVLNSCVLEDDDKDFTNFIKRVEKEIVNTHGGSIREKIINFTKQTNREDDFKKYEDIWDWPKYQY